jgi:hypothetical protein
MFVSALRLYRDLDAVLAELALWVAQHSPSGRSPSSSPGGGGRRLLRHDRLGRGCGRQLECPMSCPASSAEATSVSSPRSQVTRTLATGVPAGSARPPARRRRTVRSRAPSRALLASISFWPRYPRLVRLVWRLLGGRQERRVHDPPLTPLFRAWPLRYGATGVPASVGQDTDHVTPHRRPPVERRCRSRLTFPVSSASPRS